MNADDKIKLASTRSGRREQLKQFILDHARKFDMRYWLEAGSYSIESTIRNLAKNGKSFFAKTTFEQCGTSCCIGGAAELMAGIDKVANGLRDMSSTNVVLDEMGIKTPFYLESKLVYAHYWPTEIRDMYHIAKDRGEFRNAAIAAGLAIDFFNKNPYHGYSESQIKEDKKKRRVFRRK